MYNNQQEFLESVSKLMPQIDKIADRYVFPYNPIYESFNEAILYKDIEMVCDLLMCLSFDIQGFELKTKKELKVNELLSLSEIKAKTLISLKEDKLVTTVITLKEIQAKLKAKKIVKKIIPISQPVPIPIKKEVQILTSDL